MRALLTFTGFHDPFSLSGVTGAMRAGPFLEVVAEQTFDRVYPFTTPKAAEISENTSRAILERHAAGK